ncbi:MAG: permease [Bacteroidota bacterium]
MKGREGLDGIKVLILSIALPATIFVALLKVKIDLSLMILPILALVANFSLLAFAKYILPLFTGKPSRHPESRTMLLLIPSFAPGLSCFPFIVEFLGEDGLAYAALADIGNKIFVLILLYLLAMQLYYQVQKGQLEHTGNRVKGLLFSLAREPVNLVIVLAVIMLSLGFNMESLPLFLQNGINRMSLLMTPLVLIFIGLAVKINWRSLKEISTVLLLRSGISFLLSGLVIYFFPIGSTVLILLLVIFPQSACSFWPFAHIAAITALENKSNSHQSTFDSNLALNMLALSLPLSTMVILTICSFPNTFIQPHYVLGLGSSLILFALLSKLNFNTNPSRLRIPIQEEN